MEFLAWTFVGLLALASWLVFKTFRGGPRAGGEHRGRRQHEAQRRRNLEHHARIAADAARLHARRRKPFVEPEMASGEITFGAGVGGEARRRAAGSR